MQPESQDVAEVIPIERGRILKEKNVGQCRMEVSGKSESSVRRLIQCVELLTDLTREIARLH